VGLARMADPPPLYSQLAEGGICAGIMCDARLVDLVRSVVKPEDFHIDCWRLVYSAVLRTAPPVSVPTVCYQMALDGTIDKVERKGVSGEALIVSNICRHADWNPMAFTEGGAAANAHIVADYARRRSMLTEAQKLARAAHQPEKRAQRPYSGLSGGSVWRGEGFEMPGEK